MPHIMTHHKIDQRLCGRPESIGQGACRVSLLTLEAMAADERGLVHGGFLFGLADYAAMLAVNDPFVVLGSADVKFIKPVKVGQTIIAQARITEQKGKKHIVDVVVTKDTKEVFKGEFVCFVLEKHVLD